MAEPCAGIGRRGAPSCSAVKRHRVVIGIGTPRR